MSNIGVVTGLICRPWITTRTGRKIYAKDYGKTAFCFVPSARLLKEPEQKNNYPLVKE